LRNDDGAVETQNDYQRVSHSHGLHTKLLAMRMMQENLQRIHYRHMESNFHQIQSTVTEEAHQYKGSYQLKRLVISKGLRK
jgi:hypothetical protein